MLSKTTKNRFSYKLDKVFWFIVELLPLITYMIFCVVQIGTRKDTSWISFYDFLGDYLGLFFAEGNPFMSVLDAIFGSGSSIFPIFRQTAGGVLFYFVYVVNVEVVHICFDVIVFIPRLAHKWISKAVQDD